MKLMKVTNLRKEYWPNGNRQKYCSPECKYEHDREKLLAKRQAEKGNHVFKQKNCRICGRPFWPSNGQEVMCSAECKQKNYQEYHRVLYQEKIAPRLKAENVERRQQQLAENDGHLYPKKVCLQCGQEYWPNTKLQKYCCSECRKLSEKERKKKCSEKQNISA